MGSDEDVCLQHIGDGIEFYHNPGRTICQESSSVLMQVHATRRQQFAVGSMRNAPAAIHEVHDTAIHVQTSVKEITQSNNV